MRTLLPIGTFVSIKGRENKAMIIGHFRVDEHTRDIFNYCATDYPNGIAYPEGKDFGFNTDDIEVVHYKGFEDDEAYDHLCLISNCFKDVEQEKLNYGI